MPVFDPTPVNASEDSLSSATAINSSRRHQRPDRPRPRCASPTTSAVLYPMDFTPETGRTSRTVQRRTVATFPLYIGRQSRPLGDLRSRTYRSDVSVPSSREIEFSASLSDRYCHDSFSIETGCERLLTPSLIVGRRPVARRELDPHGSGSFCPVRSSQSPPPVPVLVCVSG